MSLTMETGWDVLPKGIGFKMRDDSFKKLEEWDWSAKGRAGFVKTLEMVLRETHTVWMVMNRRKGSGQRVGAVTLDSRYVTPSRT